MVLAILAPCTGGFEYMGRMTIFNWLSTRAFSSGVGRDERERPNTLSVQTHVLRK